MTGTVMRTALRGSLAHIHYVHPVRRGAQDGLVATVYGQLEDEFGMVAPPMALHSPAPSVLAASWLILRETLLAKGLVSRATREAVAGAVSTANMCPYCVEVHATALRGLNSRHNADAIMDDRISAIDDPDLRRIAAWARVSGTRTDAGVPPVPAEQVPELLGVVTAFQYLNRMVNVFLDDSPLPPSTPVAARGPARWVLAKVMRPSAAIGRLPGASLDLLPDAALPADLGWAAAHPTIAAAYARACAAVDAAAADTVPEAVRALVHERLATWTGAPTGPSRAWVDDTVAALPAAQRPAGRLALLTAVASYQVDEQVVHEFRQHNADDGALVTLTSWAALTAARRVSTWTPTAVPATPGVGGLTAGRPAPRPAAAAQACRNDGRNGRARRTDLP